MLKSDATHGSEKITRSRQRTSTSCTQCRRRKQKCNQAKDRPCNNCARRYPPVVCEYASSRSASPISYVQDSSGSKASKYRESLVDLKEDDTKIEEEEDAPFNEAIETFNPYGITHRHSDSFISLQGAYQFPLVSRASSSTGHASTEEYTGAEPTYLRNSTLENPLSVDEVDHQSQNSSKDEKGSNFQVTEPIDARSPYFPFPYFSIMRKHVRSSVIEPLHALPIEATRRNAELLHLFIQRLSPYMTSIDGQSPSARFNDQWMPFMIQSPILVHIGILTSSYFQAISRGIDVEKSLDVITTRVKLIALINEHLTTHSKDVNDEAVAAVMSLAYNELIYADKKSVLAHMRGLREMVRTRGGIKNLSHSTLHKLITRTDYQIACTFECEPLLDDEYHNQYIPIFVTYPLWLDSPLLQSKRRFGQSIEELRINVETAALLDDMRFLTTSVISMTKNEVSIQESSKFLATASWIHESLLSPADPALAQDFVYQSCRAVAIAYSAAIFSRTPLSQACNSQHLRQLWMNMWRAPLSRWKEIPGIFFWAALTVCPFASDKHEGRFLKGMVAATTIEIGLVDWDVVMGILRGFLAVQRWLAGGIQDPPIPSTRMSPQRRKSTSDL